MTREAALFVFAAVALCGCGTVRESRTYPVAPNAQPSPPAPTFPSEAYAGAPPARLIPDLFVCYRSASNSGPLDARGRSLVYAPLIETPAGALLRNPTEGACLSSGFGARDLNIAYSHFHTGLDLANRAGGFIYAAGRGRITALGWYEGYGLRVEIDHGAGVHTLYAHLAEIDPSLREGARVSGGQAIARMGMTGNATGVHLHYEVEIDGEKIDPLNFGLAPNVG